MWQARESSEQQVERSEHLSRLVQRGLITLEDAERADARRRIRREVIGPAMKRLIEDDPRHRGRYPIDRDEVFALAPRHAEHFEE